MRNWKRSFQRSKESFMETIDYGAWAFFGIGGIVALLTLLFFISFWVGATVVLAVPIFFSLGIVVRFFIEKE